MKKPLEGVSQGLKNLPRPCNRYKKNKFIGENKKQ
jgi:hypothetical protein